MLMPHVVQTEADKVFVNIYNSQASSVADGKAVVWNTSSPDGVKTTQPTTATLSLFVGLADGAVAAASYGLAQAYGYKSAGLITNDTSTAVAAGDILIPVDQADHLARSAASDGKTGFVFAAAAVATATTPAAANSAVFIRAL
jgi:hypothetical protein